MDSSGVSQIAFYQAGVGIHNADGGHGPEPTAKRRNWSDVMNELRRSATAALAAATVTIGSLASAQPRRRWK
jgi:hypothetical protein